MQQPQGQSLLLPWKPPATDRHVFPPELCWSEHTTEHLFANSPGGAVLTPNAHPTTQFPGRGQMAARTASPSSPRPGQIMRKNGLQVPPQAGPCHSPLTTLWWLPMFPPVKRQIVQQTALLWIHPAVHFSKEVKENPWPELLNFETELHSLKSYEAWIQSKAIGPKIPRFSRPLCLTSELCALMPS